MRKALLVCLGVFTVIATSCNSDKNKVSPEEARQIGQEAYIFDYPMTEN